MKGALLCGYWYTNEIQSHVYIINNSFATKLYIVNMLLSRATYSAFRLYIFG